MTHLLKRSDFPTLSADPQKQVLDHGFPLYRFKDSSRYLKLIRQDQVLSRTNDYKPTPATLKRQLRSAAKYIYQDVPELKDFNRKEFLDILLNDVELSRQYEEMDPLIGNSLIITDYLEEFELYLFAAGPSMSNLVISKSTGNEMTIKDTINLSYPIRQIILSPLSTLFHKIFIVRTTSSLHLFKLDEKQDLTLVHLWILHEKSIANDKIDYSMPIHVEPSPFYKYQYLFITNNGYYALMDGKQDKILFENVDPISPESNYKSRWKSCGFGKTPSTIYITSPESIKEFVIRNTEVASKILAAPNDRIIAFKASSNLLYCFATLDAIVVMDRMLADVPIVTWKHKMRDGPPTEIMIEKLKHDNWRIIAFSQHTQRYTMIHFHYVNNPLIDIKPVVKILEIYNFNLPVLKCEEIYNYTCRINSMGCALRAISKEYTDDTTRGNVSFSLCRLFEDGSMRVQYLALETNKEVSIQPPRPKYLLTSECKSFDRLMKQMQSLILPVREGKQEGLAEVCDVDMKHFKDYLESQALKGSNQLTNDFKINMAEKVRSLKSTTTFRALFTDNKQEEEEDYEQYTLESLVDFLEEMQVHENIERARQVDNISGVFSSKHQKPKDMSLHSKLKLAHEKEIQLASLMIRPLKQQEQEEDSFQYLNYDQGYKFTSTTTTRALASLWTIDDTRFEQLTFPPWPHRTNRILEKEKFPCLSIYKRKRAQEAEEEDEEPLLLLPASQSQHASQKSRTAAMASQHQDEIPMPIVAAASNSQQPQMKRAKKLKSSFVTTSRSAPTTTIELSDDEEEDRITPQKLALSITPSSSQPSASSSSSQQQPLSVPKTPPRTTSSSFTNVSTQPLPGVFGSRTKKSSTVTKKKSTKKPKTSGFR